MIPNDTYIISRDKSDKSNKSEVKITVMDKDTGTEQLSTRWSNGAHQFLQLKVNSQGRVFICVFCISLFITKLQ